MQVTSRRTAWRGNLCTALALAVAGCSGDRLAVLGDRIASRIAESDAEVVGVYFKDLVSGDSLLMAADVRVHAASMMKVPVMIQLFRDHEARLSSLDDSLTITRTFQSIVDGSPYELDAPDDSDTTLYRRVGEQESVRRLTELMVTVSSNLATNMLIEHVGADRLTATMRELGADSIEVLRGVEDTKAYRAGLSNTTTARDLGVIFSAIAEGRAVGGASGREMIEILLRQQFNTKIPAGLPPGARTAHKTGWIPDYVSHDGGIIYLDGGDVYVLVVLTKGGEGHDDYAEELTADISRMICDAVRERTVS
jgi:beta-lactamase class A